MNKNKSMTRSSKNLQLNMIKFGNYNDTPPATTRTIDSISPKNSINSISVYLSYDIEFNNKYIIEKVIYDKPTKLTGIIKSIHDNTEYIIKLRLNSCNKYEMEKIVCNLLKNKNCETIINFVDFVKNDNYFYFIYEYFEGENLAEYISNNNYSENDIKIIIKQICEAIKFLHNLNIIHGDLKLDNIIINKYNKIKVIDFDLSTVCNIEDGIISDNVFGTIQYIAPESYDLCVYSKKSDIWSLGIILYVLVTNKFPTDIELTINKSYSNLCRRNEFKHIDINYLADIINTKKYDINLLYLLEQLLKFDDSERITIEEMLQSKWLN